MLILKLISILEIKIGLRSFHYACPSGKREIVENIIKHAESSKLNLKDKDNLGLTAIQLAERWGEGGNHLN